MKILKVIFNNSLVVYISVIGGLLFLGSLVPNLVVALGTVFNYVLYGFFIFIGILCVGQWFLDEKNKPEE